MIDDTIPGFDADVDVGSANKGTAESFEKQIKAFYKADGTGGADLRRASRQQVTTAVAGLHI